MQPVHQVSADQVGMDYSKFRVGASLALVTVCYLILIGLIPINIYHAYVFLDNVLVNPNSSGFLTFLVPVVALSLSLLEIPLTKMVITEYRVNGATLKLNMMVAFSALILTGTTVGAYNSQMASAMKVDNQLTQHTTTSDNFNNKRNVLKAEWESGKIFANNLESGGAAEKSRVDKIYYASLAALGDTKAQHDATKPTKTMETGSTGHIVVIMVVGLLCSLGVMLITAFLTIYHHPLVAVPMAVVTGKNEREEDITVQLIPVTYIETTRVHQIPEWIDAAVESEHNDVPIYALETEAGYKVAILSPDKRRVLFLHETTTEEQMSQDLSDKGVIHREFADQLKVYKALHQSQITNEPQGEDLTAEPSVSRNNPLPAGTMGDKRMNDKFGVKLKKLGSLNSDDSQHIAVVKEIENGK